MTVPGDLMAVVYCFQCADIGAVKIGIAADPLTRIAEIQTGCPYLVTVGWVSSPLKRDMAFAVEQSIHGQLDKKRLMGEWFSATVSTARAAFLLAGRRNGLNLDSPDALTGVTSAAVTARDRGVSGIPEHVALTALGLSSTLSGSREVPRVFRTRDAAEYLGLSPATLTTWRCRGGGPLFSKLGRSVRYLKDDLDSFMQVRSVANTSQTVGGRLR